MARVLDIPVVEPPVYRPYGVRTRAAPALGSGVFQYDFSPSPYFSHLLLLLVPESRRQMVEYLHSCHRSGQAEIRDPFARAGAAAEGK